VCYDGELASEWLPVRTLPCAASLALRRRPCVVAILSGYLIKSLAIPNSLYSIRSRLLSPSLPPALPLSLSLSLSLSLELRYANATSRAAPTACACFRECALYTVCVLQSACGEAGISYGSGGVGGYSQWRGGRVLSWHSTRGSRTSGISRTAVLAVLVLFWYKPDSGPILPGPLGVHC
jgi:hypothetical protein